MTRPETPIVVLLSAVFALTSCAIVQAADYPWVYYFERPESARVHTAFCDPDGGIIVATGDWHDMRSEPGYNVWEYFSTGVYRINSGDIEVLPFPANSYVFDGAVASDGNLWLLIGEGQDYWIRQYGKEAWVRSDGGFRFNGFWPANVVNRRLAMLENRMLVEFPQLTDAVPGEPVYLGCDSHHRIFVLSVQREASDVPEWFVSQWDTPDPGDVRTINLSQMVPSMLYITAYPLFGQDGLIYFPFSHSLDDSQGAYKGGVFSLNLETAESEVYDESRSPFLESLIMHGWPDFPEFYIDPLNIKWFFTEDGLVRFDGQHWSRFSAADADLPHNLVVSMAYDEIDDSFYVVTCDRPGSADWGAAFSAFSAGGDRIGPSLHFRLAPYIRRGAAGIWYLDVPTVDFDGIIYAYDHDRVTRYRLRDWVGPGLVQHRSIGTTPSGRTFLVTQTCVMIW